MSSPVLREEYQLDGQDVVLTVEIGYGQLGQSAVWFPVGNLIHKGDVEELTIDDSGLGQDQRIRVKTVVADVNDNTNQMQVRYRLSGGAEPGEWALDGEVRENGNGLAFYAEFTLV